MRTGDQFQAQPPSWKSLGLKGVRERRPLSVIHCQSWSLLGHSLLPGALPQCPSLAPGDGDPRLSPGNILPQPSCHCPSRQSHSRSEGVSLPCLPLSVPSTLYSFLTHPHRVLPRQPLCSADQRLSVQALLPQDTMLSRVWGHPVVVTLMGLLSSSGRARRLLHTLQCPGWPHRSGPAWCQPCRGRAGLEYFSLSFWGFALPLI